MVDVKYEKLILRDCAREIAQQQRREPTSKFTAFRKLFLQERRDWSQPGAPRVGWKRGEFFEVLMAMFGHGNLREEWGDAGYYIAQTWNWLWRLYCAITPRRVIRAAVDKYIFRAFGDELRDLE